MAKFAQTQNPDLPQLADLRRAMAKGPENEQRRLIWAPLRKSCQAFELAAC
jgi:hypothetical protein